MSSYLYLGSQSHSRQQLLHDAHISFKTIGHSADESKCDWQLPFQELLCSIAQQKMEHVSLPEVQENKVIYVLTADTMAKDAQGIVHGKPIDKDDAVAKIKALRGAGIVGTAFCVKKIQGVDGEWRTIQSILEYVKTEYEFDMPDAWIENYLQVVPYYRQISGGITIQGFGAQFLKNIRGSYTNIIGLPMFEVRKALQELNFFNN